MKRLIIAISLLLSSTVQADVNYTPANHTPVSGPVTLVFQDPVIVNVRSGIYHGRGCYHAYRCTRNCAMTERSDAVRSGARPCKVCGGR